MKSSRTPRPRSLQIEPLESREVMAAGITATFAGGVLTVNGTDGADTINFRQKNGAISIVNVSGSWTAASVTSIVVNTKGGNDAVSVASTSNGGNQALAENFTVKSTGGADRVRLADGREAVFSGVNPTFTVSSTGVAKLNGLNWGATTPPTPPKPPTPPTPTNWFTANVVDAALKSLGATLYADGSINRNDMIALLRSAQDGNVVDATELADLRKIAGTTTIFAGQEHVWKLASYVVSANPANAKFQGQNLGNLAAGSTNVQLEKLIGKWFLGLDRPTAASGTTYRQAVGQLFVNGASYTDIRQGNVGDCYFLAALGEVALKSPATITNMFVVNGDGTYTVKFYNGSTTEYVTVDSYLPTAANGTLVYAARGTLVTSTSGELWTAFAEKAYVQLNERGWQRAGLSGSGQNSYAAINGGYIYAALGHITGKAATPFTATAGTSSFQTFVTAWTSGKMIGFASLPTPASTTVVGSHAYAVIGYNAAAKTVTLYNPWGPEYATVTLTWSQVQANFGYFDRC